MTDPKQAEMDEAIAAFKRADEANDPTQMRAIAKSPAYHQALVREAQEETDKGLLRRAGGAEDRLDRLVMHVLATKAIQDANTAILRASIRALRARVEELEKTPFAYDGPHEGGKTYAKNTLVSCQGSMWIANYKTAARPGDGPSWTLCVKRGADGKDLRA